MNDSNISRMLFHDAISVVLDTLASKYVPTDNSTAVVDIELHTRLSDTHSRRNTRTIGLSNGDELDSKMFWKTRHNLSIRSIKLAPGTDLLLGDWRMFGKVFKVHNGSDKPHTFNFRWYKPSIHSIKVVEGEKDGTIYDGYHWGWYIFNTKVFPFILTLVVIAIVTITLMINGKKQKELYTATGEKYITL